MSKDGKSRDGRKMSPMHVTVLKAGVKQLTYFSAILLFWNTSKMFTKFERAFNVKQCGCSLVCV